MTQNSPLLSLVVRKSRNDVWSGMIGRFSSEELTLLNNEPRRRSNITTASPSSSSACCRRVVRERILRGSIEVISCPTTDRNRGRVSWSVKYPSSTSLYNPSNGSCPSRFVLAFNRWLIHFFLL